jgi:hypothetical protein
MQPGGADLGVNTLSAAAAAHQMSRLGEAFKDSLAHQMPSKAAGGMGPSPYGVSLPQQQYGLPSTSGHSDRLYGGSANPFPSHAGGMGGGLSEKSSPRSSAQRGSTDDGYGLPAPGRGSGDRGAQLPAPSMASQLGNGGGAAHQAAVSLSHIAGASSAGSQQQHQSSNSVPQQPPTVRTAASMNPKGTPSIHRSSHVLEISLPLSFGGFRLLLSSSWCLPVMFFFAVVIVISRRFLDGAHL